VPSAAYFEIELLLAFVTRNVSARALIEPNRSTPNALNLAQSKSRDAIVDIKIQPTTNGREWQYCTQSWHARQVDV
jgi:hypothetical protein